MARELLLLDNDEPATYAEVTADLDSESWQDAMKSEIESMKKNQVWNLIGPPVGVTHVGYSIYLCCVFRLFLLYSGYGCLQSKNH